METLNHTWFVALSVLCGLDLVICLNFIVRYWWSSHGAWTRDEYGRNQMGFVIIIAAGLALILADWLTVTFWGRQYCWAAIFIGIGYFIFKRSILQTRAQRHRHDDDTTPTHRQP